MIALPLWLGLAAIGAEPTAFPEPTQFDAKPFAARLDDDALAVAYSSDGSLLAAGCADGTVRFCDPSNGRPVAKLAGHHKASVTQVAWGGANGNRLGRTTFVARGGR